MGVMVLLGLNMGLMLSVQDREGLARSGRPSRMKCYCWLIVGSACKSIAVQCVSYTIYHILLIFLEGRIIHIFIIECTIIWQASNVSH